MLPSATGIAAECVGLAVIYIHRCGGLPAAVGLLKLGLAKTHTFAVLVDPTLPLFGLPSSSSQQLAGTAASQKVALAMCLASQQRFHVLLAG